MDKLTQSLFDFRNDTSLDSRIRFKIQDIIDAYNKEWRYVVVDQKNKTTD